MSATVDLIDSAAPAASVLHPLRSRILEALDEPDSAAGVARRLDVPRQKVNYHLRLLEKQGLVELVETRRKGNCVERLLRARARSFLISPEVLGNLAADPAKIRDRFSSSYLVALAAKTIRDLAVQQRRAEEVGKRLPTLSLQSTIRFASPDDQNAFAEELSDAVARLVAKYHHEDAADGRSFELLLGCYPQRK